MMFLSRFGRMESGKLFLKDKSNTCKYEAREYWYIEFTADISDNTKNRTAPSLAAGL